MAKTWSSGSTVLPSTGLYRWKVGGVVNYKALSHDEAAFTLFAFKRVLRDKGQFTPAMVQFYERSIEILSKKITSMEEKANDPRPYADQVRDRLAQVPTIWPDN